MVDVLSSAEDSRSFFDPLYPNQTDTKWNQWNQPLKIVSNYILGVLGLNNSLHSLGDAGPANGESKHGRDDGLRVDTLQGALSDYLNSV